MKRLLEYFNLSWNGYRKVRKGVKKRIARHINALNLSGIDEYLELVEKDEDIRNICLCHLSVSISRFYRDRNLWNGLENKILPVLIDRFSEEPDFKVWSCGCARGEEAYSFLMMWESMKGVRKEMPGLEMYATDMNPTYIEMAMEGIYEFRSLKELPESFIEKYFSKLPGGKKYKLHSHLKEMVTFKKQNFIREYPPSEQFHLVFARNNILTYYNDPEKTNGFLKITNALKEGGALITGSHEKIPDNIFCLRRCHNLPCLHFKEKR